METLAPKDLLDFTGKSVLVTGAGSGLGRGIALRFAEAGASVVVHYHQSASGAGEVQTAIETLGRPAVSIAADLTQRQPVESLFQQAIDRFGSLDVLINNAGVYPVTPLLQMQDSDWDQVLDANLRSLFLCTQVFARHHVQQGGTGAIVNIASIEAHNPAPGHSHYNAAKGGVVMHTRSSANELGPHGIRVNSVSPGLIGRDGLEQAWPEGVRRWLAAAPLGRLGHASDVADACLFLASPAARWITGTDLIVDGGVLTKQIF